MSRSTESRLQWTPAADSVSMRGVADRIAHWVEEQQLPDPALWAKFVDQFRVRADSSNRGWRGEYWGKMMRGAVMIWQYTRDPALYRVLTDSVRDLLTAADGDGAISSYLPEKNFCGWDMWCRKYVMLGLEYYLEICRDGELTRQITDALCRHADAVLRAIGDGEGQIAITKTSSLYGGMNSCSILEPMVRLYRLTGEERYLKFAEYILSTGGSEDVNIFAKAYRDEQAPYEYGVNKAYEMMSCFEGVAEYWEVTGDPYWRDAAIRFGRQVLRTDVTVIGCCGTVSEFFDCSALRQTAQPDGVVQETCVSVTWMKLCRRLFAMSGDPVFLDAVEQTFYNAFLSAQNTECRHAKNAAIRFKRDVVPTLLPFDSYSPLVPGLRGIQTGGCMQFEDGSYYGCCCAIAPAGAGILPSSVLWRSGETLLLAFYEPGTYTARTPSGQTLTFGISGSYPAGLTVPVTLHLAAPERFTLCLRVPGWSWETVLTVNGEAIPAGPGIVRVERLWHDGDRIRLEMDGRTRMMHAPVYDPVTFYRIDWSNGSIAPVPLEQKDEDRRMVHFARGPLALAIDRRLGRDPRELVGVSESFTAEEIPAGKIPYPCLFAERLTFGGESIVLTDYSSVGKTWDSASECAAWIPSRPVGER